MKKTVILLISLLFTIMAKAGDGDTHVGFTAGLLYHNTLNSTLSYEKELAYGNAYELLIDCGNKWEKDPVCGKVCDKSFWKGYYWGLGVDYKYLLSRGKNTLFHLRFGPQIGANKGKFDFGVELGFEYTIISYKGIEFCLIQKNQMMLRSNDRFRNGLLIGVKIPL